jgi:glycosyltransferase involved in cell wall biosynthesis
MLNLETDHYKRWKVNIHIYPSPFKNESRILKITKTLSEAYLFDKIYILATWEDGLEEVEALDGTREVIRVHRKLGGNASGFFWRIIKTVEWSWGISRTVKGMEIHCINCHSLTVLPLCVFLKLIHDAKLIYDTHELETENAGAKGVRRLLSKIVEKVFIHFVDEMIAVNQSIAQWYQRRYGLTNVWVVMNVPYRHEGVPIKTRFLRDILRVQEEEILFLYLGAMGNGRAIDLLLKIFSKCADDRHIVFIGYGKHVESVKKYATCYRNIHYHPAVRPEEIQDYAASADVGLSIIENVCLSYYLCLPNKLFEYMNSGLPVIVSDFPMMASIVDDYDVGWKVPLEASKIEAIINSVTRQEIIEKRSKVLQARKFFGWHFEEPTLLKVYENLGFKKRSISKSSVFCQGL